MASAFELAQQVSTGTITLTDVAPDRRDRVERLVKTLSKLDLFGPEGPPSPAAVERPTARRVRAG